MRNNVSLDDFTVIKMIGRGDVGKVYLVRHNESQQLFAMKMLEKREMLKRNKVKRALTEREILATADHPFIVGMHWYMPLGLLLRQCRLCNVSIPTGAFKVRTDSTL